MAAPDTPTPLPVAPPLWLLADSDANSDMRYYINIVKETRKEELLNIVKTN